MSDGAATTFVVATDGDDLWPGTAAQPFATLPQAQAAVRHSLASAARGPVTVVLRGGTHRLPQTLVFGPRDGGTPGRPVTYRAMAGETVTCSGGVRVAGPWRPFRDGIWVCSAEGLPATCNQLFVNGQRQVRARFPNGDTANPSPAAHAVAAGADGWPHRELRFDPSTFSPRSWARPEEAVVHCFTRAGWGNVQWSVAGMDRADGVLHLGAGGWQMATTFQGAAGGGIGSGCRFFVENVFEELDAPGEWYHDRVAGALYYLPPAGLDLATALVEVAGLDRIIAVQGTREDPVRHLHLAGLRFAHTRTTFLERYEEPSLGDWAIARTGALFVEGVADSSVSECLFDAVGGNAIFVSGWAERLRLTGNTIRAAGDSGICLVGQSHLRPDRSSACQQCGHVHPWAWDAPKAAIPAGIECSNNLIHEIGVYGKQTAGIFLSLCRDVTVNHNHIWGTPRAAICINDGPFGGHRITYNDIHDTVRETGDHGPLNAWGRDAGWCAAQSHGPASHPAGMARAQPTTICFNRFRDRRGWGIDLDDGASDYVVEGNVCIGVSVKLREGARRHVTRNVFVHPANPPGIHVGYEDNGDRFEGNAVLVLETAETPEGDVDFAATAAGGAFYQIIYPPRRGPILDVADGNLFWCGGGPFFVSLVPRDGGPQRRLSLAQWQSLGYDRAALFAEPGFVNAPEGDLRLRPGAAAAALDLPNLAGVGLLPGFRFWPGPTGQI